MGAVVAVGAGVSVDTAVVTGVAVVDGGEVNSADDPVAGVVVGGVDEGLVDDGNGNDAFVLYDDDNCTCSLRTLSKHCMPLIIIAV